MLCFTNSSPLEKVLREAIGFRRIIHAYIGNLYYALPISTHWGFISTDDPTKTEHLLALEGAKERLHLFKADLLEEGSFDSIVEGCEGVFHTASPVMLDVADPKVQPLQLQLHFSKFRFVDDHYVFL